MLRFGKVPDFARYACGGGADCVRRKELFGFESFEKNTYIFAFEINIEMLCLVYFQE